jgi:hypothetical protein
VTGLVLFIHGTGVRELGWADSFAVVEQRLLGMAPGTRVRGCFWGGAQGAELKAGGASIPEYDETSKTDPSPAEEDLALWAVLYTDPWYELRLLGDWPADDDEFAPGQVPPSALLAEQIEGLVPSAELHQLLSRHDLRAHFQAAHTALLAAQEVERAIAAATEATVNEHRKAVARALVAWTLVNAERAGEPPIDGAARDQIVAVLVGDLHGYGMGLAAWLTRPFKGVALNMITQRIARRRGALTDATAPAAGDIMRYQARGSGIRNYIRQVVADAVADDPAPSVTLLAHSLGGIACVDALVETPIAGVDRLITVGSQAPFLYEIDALASLPYGAALPDHFPPWLNIYDRRDFLSYVGAVLFPGRVTDHRVDNEQPFPQAHSAYWRNDAVWQRIAEFLA